VKNVKLLIQKCLNEKRRTLSLLNGNHGIVMEKKRERKGNKGLTQNRKSLGQGK